MNLKNYVPKSYLFDFILNKNVFLILITAIFFMHASMYYDFCFPNCYAWKELMIKWEQGEFVRRGLLGTLFYFLEPYVPIKISSMTVIYSCVIITSYFIYTYLKKLSLPHLLLWSIVLSPSLLLFNLHYVLVLRKDIVAICSCIIIILLTNIYWRNNKNRNFFRLSILYIVGYDYLLIFFLLTYEIFISFVPFICLYIFVTLNRYKSMSQSCSVTFLIVLNSILIFIALIVPNLDEHKPEQILSMVADWKNLYPSLQIFTNRPDPFYIRMFDLNQYKDSYLSIVQKTNFYELVIMYVLTFIPIMMILIFKLVNIDIASEQLRCFYDKHKFLCVSVILICIHMPFVCLSMVAFDYGRWLVMSFYLAVLFLCFFTKKSTNENLLNSFNKKLGFLGKWVVYLTVFIFEILYLFTWQPQHWGGDGSLIDFNQAYMYKNVLVFYSSLLGM